MYTRRIRGWAKHADFILVDIVALQIAFALSYVLRNGGGTPYADSSYRLLAMIYAALDFLVAVVFNTMHNVVKRGALEELGQTAKQVTVVLMGMALALFSAQLGEAYSRLIVYYTAGLHLVLGYATRLAWKVLLRSLGVKHRKAAMVLVADERYAPRVLGNVLPSDRFRFTGLVLSNRDAVGEEVCGVPVVANLSDAADWLCREWVDGVFVYPEHMSDIEVRRSAASEAAERIMSRHCRTMADSVQSGMTSTSASSPQKRKDAEADAWPEGSVAALIEQCRQMAIPVHIRLPLENLNGKSFVERLDGFSVLTVASNSLSPMQTACKRLLDIVGGLVGSVLALIVIAVVGPIIKLKSPGPILFKQTRVGQNGKRFKLYKIRSMYLDAEERKRELMDQNRVSDGMMFKVDWDPRIIGNRIVDGERRTGIGELIRKTSLDEFPQFFNVLLGQMSLVGTRPPTEDEWEKYQYHHRARLATKPGITGMWQVSGRSQINDFEEVVTLDTEYIQNWSMALDLKILLRTVKVVYAKIGAM